MSAKTTIEDSEQAHHGAVVKSRAHRTAERSPDQERITIYVPPDVARAFGRLAVERGTNRNALIREAMRTYLAQTSLLFGEPK